MNKKLLTEADIRTKFITPALVGAHREKWNVMTQIQEEAYFTKGRVIVRGKMVTRGEAKKADYILSYKPNLPLAVIEAKDNNHSVGAGMQQALDYAEILDVPFAYSSNGDDVTSPNWARRSESFWDQERTRDDERKATHDGREDPGPAGGRRRPADPGGMPGTEHQRSDLPPVADKHGIDKESAQCVQFTQVQ